MGKKFYIVDNVCTPYKLILHRISNYLVANDWLPVSSLMEADVAIVGTCGAFHSLANESLEYIKEAREAVEELVVFGCLPNILPEKVKAFKPDRIIPSPRWEEFEKLVEEPAISINDAQEANEFRLKEEYRLYDPGKKFVLIQTGCSSDCPYCPHKLGIGDLRSRPFDKILCQVQKLTQAGAHTIILHGNDTGSYGTDIGRTYPELLKEVMKVSPKLHLTQLNADWVYKYRQELFDLAMDEKVKDFQVLIQTSSSRLLELMERQPVVKKLKSFLKKIRNNKRNIVFRTDVIIGYPTATEAEEMETLEFVTELFDEVAVHGFERFPHTRIEKMGLPFYSQEIINERVKIALEFLKQYPTLLVHRGGQVYQTLVDIEELKEQMRSFKSAEQFCYPEQCNN